MCERVARVTMVPWGVEWESRRPRGALALLGGAAASRRHLTAATAGTHDRNWPYFRNAGLGVRAGTTADAVEVPEGWRERVAVSWGDSPPSASVRFLACPGRPGRAWNSYAGGFHLRSAGDCVPLHVRVGGQSTTLRVGVGRTCGE